MWFPNRSDTNPAVQAQKKARCWKFWIYKVEELYYLCSKNKGTDDQLRGYQDADLRLCFCIIMQIVFSRCGSFVPICLQTVRRDARNLVFVGSDPV